MIRLEKVCPTPLKDKDDLHQSSIWNQALTFNKGELYLIKAASGKGKTTLMHLLYGLRSDYEGELYYENKPYREISLDYWAKIRRQHLSVVFQDLRLFESLTLWENLQLQLALDQSSTELEVKEMCHRLQMDPFIDKKIALLSYGQRQRVAIIRSLCRPFDLLLLDEPFSHLDEENMERASLLIKEKCAAQKAGIIMLSLGDSYLFEYQHSLNL